MIEIVLTAFFGIVIGLSLGLTGGGGSIFAVPLLIYGIGLPPVQAVHISLATVAVTALIGAVQTVKEHLLLWQPAVVFIIGGMIGAPLGVMYTKLIDGRWIVSG
ncbi:MAG: TSUP family transporter, partial [Gammaproteobacteria bacterium]|nr:TSUP family transporter [Gammaproteobacteria bacterium]